MKNVVKRKMENNEQQNQKENNLGKFKIISSAIIFGSIIIALALIVVNNPASSNTQNNQYQKNNSALSLMTPVTDDDFIRGNPDAPITIIEYGDFGCYFCGVVHDDIKQIVEKRNDVRWVYRHLPFRNPLAADVSECIGILSGNDAFWETSDVFYANQADLDEEFYVNHASSYGISEESLTACLQDEDLKTRTRKEFIEARNVLGFEATPYMVIQNENGDQISFAGALSMEDLEIVLDKLK